MRCVTVNRYFQRLLLLLRVFSGTLRCFLYNDPLEEMAGGSGDRVRAPKARPRKVRASQSRVLGNTQEA